LEYLIYEFLGCDINVLNYYKKSHEHINIYGNYTYAKDNKGKRLTG